VPAHSLTGGRIRERRIVQGIKQADLAKQIGISASYLNLIEHNRRRIGGKLLLDIAGALKVEPQALTEGAEAGLLGHLGEAALAANLSPEDTGHAEAFAGRFPAWAEALAASQRRVAALERTVETLSDRIAHDPLLADSMHELLTTAAAVRSTAEILVGESGLEREWRDRFHANLDADSLRLARSAQSLAQYLEQTTGPAAGKLSPQEEVEAYLEAQSYYFPQFEARAAPATAEAVLEEGAVGPMSEAARYVLRGVLEQVRADAAVLPLDRLARAVDASGLDPVALAHRFGVAPALMMRRLASLPDLGAGLVVCDRSGTVIFRKSVDGFTVPRFDSCCALWLLFGALAATGTVLHEKLGQLGRGQVHFDAYATTDPGALTGYNSPAPARGVMLLVPLGAAQGAAPKQAVGVTCRICPHDSCSARREPSIMAGA
jgi:predicted transcriptional regulator/transcriptional regulator with XRE-family HTH domain